MKIRKAIGWFVCVLFLHFCVLPSVAFKAADGLQHLHEMGML
jgi:hypothetical protein